MKTGIEIVMEVLKEKAPIKSITQRIQFLLDLVKTKEVHTCDQCDHTHEVETGLFDIEQIKPLIEELRNEITASASPPKPT